MRAALAVLLLLALAETVSRVAIDRLDLPAVEADPFFGFFGFQTFFEAEDVGPGERLRTRPSNVDDSMMRALAFQRRARPGDLRIVCVGGSVTRAEFPFHMGDVLGAGAGHPGVAPPAPHHEIEVVNAGFGGMGSTRLLLLVRELLGYDTGLLVISSGHNEFLERNFYRPLLERGPWVLRAQSILYRSAAARLLRAGLRPVRALVGADPDEAVSPLYRDMENRPFPGREGGAAPSHGPIREPIRIRIRATSQTSTPCSATTA
ncbi:MAG: hypothetical protein QF860_11115 [Planctomycetota bacterium]|nr:hypothetical protein [Planctomycetota bacterium]